MHFFHPILLPFFSPQFSTFRLLFFGDFIFTGASGRVAGGLCAAAVRFYAPVVLFFFHIFFFRFVYFRFFAPVAIRECMCILLFSPGRWCS